MEGLEGNKIRESEPGAGTLLLSSFALSDSEWDCLLGKERGSTSEGRKNEFGCSAAMEQVRVLRRAVSQCTQTDMDAALPLAGVGRRGGGGSQHGEA